MSDRYLLPGAIVLAALILAFTFRTDYSLKGDSFVVVKHSRITGSTTVCIPSGSSIKDGQWDCF